MLEHGRYQMRREGQVILISAFQAFNKEGLLKWAQEYKSLAEPIKANPWACLCDISQWELFPPEAWEVIGEVNHWCNANNLKFLVFTCDNDIKIIKQEMLKKSHSVMNNVTLEFCDNFQQGYDWLDSVGFDRKGQNT